MFTALVGRRYLGAVLPDQVTPRFGFVEARLVNVGLAWVATAPVRLGFCPISCFVACGRRGS